MRDRLAVGDEPWNQIATEIVTGLQGSRVSAQFIEAYFSGTREVPAVEGNTVLKGASSALNRFVDVNVEQAETSLRDSKRWDDLGDRIELD